MNVTAACNLVIANYNAVMLLLDTALSLPRATLLLCDKLVKMTEDLVIDNVTSICSFYVNVAMELKIGAETSSADLVKSVLLCPLILKLMPKDEIDSYIEEVEKYAEMGDLDFSAPSTITDKLIAGANAASSLASGDMHAALEANVYMMINNYISTVENYYYEDLAAIGLPGESVMSLLGYLQLGSECINDFCSNMKDLITPYEDLIAELRITPASGVLVFDPWKDYPSNLWDKCKEAAAEVADAATQIADVNKDLPKREDKDPYLVSVWA